MMCDVWGSTAVQLTYPSRVDRRTSYILVQTHSTINVSSPRMHYSPRLLSHPLPSIPSSSQRPPFPSAQGAASVRPPRSPPFQVLRRNSTRRGTVLMSFKQLVRSPARRSPPAHAALKHAVTSVRLPLGWIAALNLGCLFMRV